MSDRDALEVSLEVPREERWQEAHVRRGRSVQGGHRGKEKE